MTFKTTAQALVLTGTLGSLASQAKAQNCPYTSITETAKAAGINNLAETAAALPYRINLPAPREGAGQVSIIHSHFDAYMASIKNNPRLVDETNLVVGTFPSLDPNRSDVLGHINLLTPEEIRASGAINDGIKSEVLSLGAMLAAGKTCPTAAETPVIATPPSEANKFQKTLDDQRNYNKKSTRTAGCWAGGTGYLLGLLTLGLVQGIRAIIRKVRS